jgi:GT2 family glycosyltransferase
LGAFLIARAEVLDTAGSMDERSSPYSEETDWCNRFHELGWDVGHLPVMNIVHHFAAATEAI